MKRNFCGICKYTLLLTILLLNYGCRGSSDVLKSNGFLINPSGTESAGVVINSGLLPLEAADGGETIARVHNPEPGTLLLLGSGMLAMSLYRRKQKIR